MIKALPKLDVNDFGTAIDFILEFYEQLGWDRSNQVLDPRKIRIQSEAWNLICAETRQRWGIPGAMTWMNYGPSGGEEDNLDLPVDCADVGVDAFVEVDCA